MGSGGIGVTLGSRRQNSDGTLDFKGHTPTLVGAIDGNATIHAGRSDTLRIPRHQFCHFINCYSTTEPFQQLWSQFIDSGVMDKTGAKKRRSPYAVRLSGVESL